MCGIAGAFAMDGRPVAGPEVARAMCRVIVHRGPDDEGIHFDDGVFIGMRRLAIIDLDSGHQPVHNEDRSVWVVFNGEIYNFEQLRRDLIDRGHEFRTRGDAEVIVHCYEEYGPGCFERFRGMFGIAIWDARNRKLVLARDRLGKKPLYYTRAGRTLVFGSELKSLLQYPGVSRELDAEAVRDYVLMGYVPTPRSIFREVSKLPPGHVLTCDAGGIRIDRYWNLEFTPKHEAPESELVERLEQELSEAVRVRLVSDVPFGAFLSGGLDSSVVVALMARHMEMPVKTFSIGFREAGFNELDDARLVANHLGTEHHELIVEAEAVRMLEDLVWHFDEPFADSSAIPTFLVSKMAAEHVKMVLSGDGGDEAFGGYDRYLRYRIIRQLRRWGPKVSGTVLRLGSHLAPGGTGRRLRWLARRVEAPFPDRYLSGVALTTPEFAAELLGTQPEAGGYGTVAGAFSPESVLGDDAMIQGDIATYLLDDILVKVDRMTMANSLEARAPLLDHQLLEFAARLPFEYKIRGRTTKYLLRQVAARLLPPAALVKPKQGFAIPLARWFRGELRELAADMLHSRAFAERGVFDAGTARRCLEEHVAGHRDHGEHLWQVLTFELWARRFLDSAPHAERRAGGDWMAVSLAGTAI